MRFALLIACSVSLLGCGQDAATRMCRSENEQLQQLLARNERATQRVAMVVYQACANACQSTNDEESCRIFRDVTTRLCKEDRDACRGLCEDLYGHRNEAACALLE